MENKNWSLFTTALDEVELAVIVIGILATASMFLMGGGASAIVTGSITAIGALVRGKRRE